MDAQQQRLGTGSVVGVSLLANAIAWFCCISAVVLGFLGLSAASGYFAMLQMKYHWWLVALAFISFDIAIYYLLKQKYGQCDMRAVKHSWVPIVFTILLTLAIYFGFQAITPALVNLANVPM